ncbi:MAG: hypothetical protein ACE5FJ_00625 [Gemmatimonadales bacterium]
MSDRRRSEYVKRLSVAGWGNLESVQLLLNSIAGDVADALARDEYDKADAEAAARFRGDVFALWQATLHTDPMIDPRLLKERLSALREKCVDPVARFAERLDRAVAKAEALIQEYPRLEGR